MTTNWIDGTTRPTHDGDYFIIIEAQRDFGDFKKGDIEVTTDYFYTDSNEFYSIGDESTWKTLYWANIDLSGIPQDVKDRVITYFGYSVDGI